jgi:hypothetical protein
MKTLTDIQSDMSDLYEAVKDGSTELKMAGELANIAGKYLKAEQLKLAREIFVSHRSSTDAPGLPPAQSQADAERAALTVMQN